MNAHTENILKHAQTGGVFVFNARGVDRLDPTGHAPAEGEVVRLVPEGTGPTNGCPPQGTMDHVFVEAPGGCDPAFYGLVSTFSLTPLGDSPYAKHQFIASVREVTVVDGKVRFTDEAWEELTKYDGRRLRQCFEDWLTEHYLTD